MKKINQIKKKEESKISLKENLKTARKKLGLTQEQVANQLGITKSAYCGYETGKRQPDVAKLKELAKFLNIKVDTLLETGYGQHNEGFSEKEKKLVSAYREHPELRYAVDKLLGIDGD